MESFFPFIREWTAAARVTIVIVTMLRISQIFLAEFLSHSFSSGRVNQSGGKASAPLPDLWQHLEMTVSFRTLCPHLGVSAAIM